MEEYYQLVTYIYRNCTYKQKVSRPRVLLEFFTFPVFGLRNFLILFPVYVSQFCIDSVEIKVCCSMPCYFNSIIVLLEYLEQNIDLKTLGRRVIYIQLLSLHNNSLKQRKITVLVCGFYFIKY